MRLGRCVRVVLAWGVPWVAFAAVSACDEPPPFPPPTDTCTILPTLSSLKENYFARSCVFSGCHLGRRAEANLDLTTDDLHALLVGVGVEDALAAARGKIRVVPGDPDGSFMLQKVENRQAADEGGIMPEDADGPVDPDCRIKMLRQWIADGALDN